MDFEETETAALRSSEEVEVSVLPRPEEKTENSRTSLWPLFGTLLPRLEIVFVCQMIAIYSVLGVSLFNLTTGDAEAPDGKLWIALLSSCLGYMLPNPKIQN